MTDEIKKLEVVIPKDTTHIDMNGLKQLFMVASVARTLDVFAGIAMDFAVQADKELDRLAPFTQWVEAATELPPRNQWVTIYHPDHGQGIGTYNPADLWDAYYPGVRGGYPTHWHVMIDNPKGLN